MSKIGVIIALVLSGIFLIFLVAAFYYGFSFIRDADNGSEKREFILKQVIIGTIIAGVSYLIFLFIKLYSILNEIK